MNVDIKIYNEEDHRLIRPFIRWAGGKQNMVKYIINEIPKKNLKNYYEPFLGAGSVFLASDFNSSFLSDINFQLVNCYNQIKQSPVQLHEAITELSTNLTAENYYTIRDLFNSDLSSPSINQAAKFIVLVQSSFNGIYRVNKNGCYNVPFGKNNPSLPTVDLLNTIQNKLRKATLRTCFYDETIDAIEKGDFVYLDPPYPPINKTSTFQHYTIDKFPIEEQQKVADFAIALKHRGAKVLISNADTKEIREFYKGWKIQEIEATRFVSCKSKRNKVQELLIKNF